MVYTVFFQTFGINQGPEGQTLRLNFRVILQSGFGRIFFNRLQEFNDDIGSDDSRTVIP